MGGPKNLFPCKTAKTPAIDSSRGAGPNGVCVGYVRAFFCRVWLVAKKTPINPEGRTHCFVMARVERQMPDRPHNPTLYGDRGQDDEEKGVEQLRGKLPW